MKIVLIRDGKVFNITQYKSLEEASELAPGGFLYVEAPDEIQEGWHYNPINKTFFQPVPQLENIMPIEQARDVITAQSFGVDIPPETLALAQTTILKSIGVCPSETVKDDWREKEFVDIGCIRTHGNTSYICKHACVTDEKPDEALWDIHNEPQEEEKFPWTPEETLAIGDKRECGGKTYRCVVGHTAHRGWEPHRMPSLWSIAETG